MGCYTMEVRDKREANTSVINGHLTQSNAHIQNYNVPVQHIKLNTGKQVSVSYLGMKRCFEFLSSLIMSVVMPITLAVLAL